jgi:hypothetical protein
MRETWMGRLKSTLRALVLVILLTPQRASRAEAPPPRVSPVLAASIWTAAQLVPSPLLVAGSGPVGSGVRWQLTPFVYSFGVAAEPVRAFVIEPVARHSGAVELYISPEWVCCAPGDRTSWIGRGGGRIYLPLLGRGESLAGSIGGSYYRAGGGGGGAVEIGVYVLFGVLGLTVTVSPTLSNREVISALTIRYF